MEKITLPVSLLYGHPIKYSHHQIQLKSKYLLFPLYIILIPNLYPAITPSSIPNLSLLNTPYKHGHQPPNNSIRELKDPYPKSL
jgi:hypothetical protein